MDGVFDNIVYELLHMHRYGIEEETKLHQLELDLIQSLSIHGSLVLLLCLIFDRKQLAELLQEAVDLLPIAVSLQARIVQRRCSGEIASKLRQIMEVDRILKGATLFFQLLGHILQEIVVLIHDYLQVLDVVIDY